MADFREALKYVMESEGVYSDDSRDPGGETYWGIARRRHPDWRGWPMVDQMDAVQKRAKSPPAEVWEAVEDFYRAEFWRPLQGDLLPQRVATKLLDTSVNLGVRWGVRALQRAINLLSTSPIVEDGVVGQETLRALRRVLSGRGEEAILLAIAAQQIRYYLDLADRYQHYRVFLFGWLRRGFRMP